MLSGQTIELVYEMVLLMGSFVMFMAGFPGPFISDFGVYPSDTFIGAE